MEKPECSVAQEPLELNSRHRVMMRLLLAGKSPTEIAKEMGYTMSRVSIITNSELFKKEKEKMSDKINALFIDCEATKVQTDRVRIRLDEEALPSLEKVIGLRNSAKNERVQQISAFDILDRAGYSKVEKLETSGSVEVGEGLANALKEACKVIRAKDS